MRKPTKIRASLVLILVLTALSWPLISNYIPVAVLLTEKESKISLKENWDSGFQSSNKLLQFPGIDDDDFNHKIEVEFRVNTKIYNKIRVDQTVPIIISLSQFAFVPSLKEYYQDLGKSDSIWFAFDSKKRLIERADKNKLDWVGLNNLEHAVRLSLRSSGFDIEPKEVITVDTQQKLPRDLIWTVTPKKTGSHSIVLDFENILTSEQAAIIKAGKKVIFESDIERVFHDNSNSIVIDVDVLTKWGVSQLLEDIVRGFLALCGLIIAFPLFSNWLKSSTNISKAPTKKSTRNDQ